MTEMSSGIRRLASSRALIAPNAIRSLPQKCGELVRRRKNGADRKARGRLMAQASFLVKSRDNIALLTSIGG